MPSTSSDAGRDEATAPDPRWRGSLDDGKTRALTSADAASSALTMIAACMDGTSKAPATVAMTKIAVHQTMRTRSSRQRGLLVAGNHRCATPGDFRNSSARAKYPYF